MGRKLNNISGKRYGNLLVLDENERISLTKWIKWKCVCDCGEYCYATSTDLERGRVNYCPKCVEIKSKNAPINKLYGSYKYNALKRSLCFDLDFESFKSLINQNCFYCGSVPKQIMTHKGMKYDLIYNGIDRRNNNIGYTNENSVTACKYCNLGKSVFKEEEFIEWINNIKKNV